MNFASPKKPFSISVLRNLLYNAKSEDDLTPVKAYITSYFAPLSKEILLWHPEENKYEALSDNDVKARYLRKDEVSIRLPPGPDGKQQTIEFSIRKWFFVTYPTIYSRAFNLRKPKLYKIDNQIYINSFAGFLHTKIRPFSEYSHKLQDGVKSINRHIQTVWCSNSEALTEYTLNWIAHMISGRKMETVLFIQSPPGTGKGTITEFIREKVLGDNIVKISMDPNTITSTFNKQLEGYILLILEEMPTGKGEWHTFSQRMKYYANGKKIEIHEKNKTPYSLDNNLSFIFNTNNRNAIRLETGDRRYVYLDVSVERMGDDDYFDELYEIMDLPGIGEAYYAYMLERARNTPKFKERKIPRTNAKRDQIIDSLHKVHKYIKENYLKSRIGINMPFSEFYQSYTTNGNDDTSSRQRIRKLLEDEVGLKTILIKKQNWYKISPVELYEAYNKKGFIQEIEEIEPPNGYIAPINTEKNDVKGKKTEILPEKKSEESPSESSKSSKSEEVIEVVENTPEVVEKPRLIPRAKDLWEYQQWLQTLFRENPEYIDDPELKDPLHLYNMYVEETGDPPGYKPEKNDEEDPIIDIIDEPKEDTIPEDEITPEDEDEYMEAILNS